MAEHAAVGREYQRQSTIRHNRFQKDLADKIWLQQEAMKSLPSDLRELAEVVDEEPPPPERPFPIFATPPIKGFNAMEYIGRDDDDDDEDEEGNDALNKKPN